MSLRQYLSTLPDTSLIYEGADLCLHLQSSTGWLSFDSPSRSVNVLSLSHLPQIEAALNKIDSLITTSSLSFLIITSNKPHSFIAGADISSLYPTLSLSTLTDASRTLQRLLNHLESLPIPTLAAINGTCLGAGLELALSCDYRLCLNEPTLLLGLPEVKLGLIPGAGGTVRLPEVIGLREALTMILTGSSINGKKAMKIGLVDGVREEEGFWKDAESFKDRGKRQRGREMRRRGWKEWWMDDTFIGQWLVVSEARRRLDKQTKGKYRAPYFALHSTWMAVKAGRTGEEREKALEREAAYFGRLAATPESKALMSVFYLMEDAKKRAVHVGKPSFHIKRVAIIGLKGQGVEIATQLALKRIRVYLRDEQAVVNRVLQAINEHLSVRVKQGKLEETEAEEMVEMIEGAEGWESVQDCDIILEAVEGEEEKHTILKSCQPYMKSQAVFAFTSPFIAALTTDGAAHAGRVIGLHFPPSSPLVEVVRSETTEQEVVAAVYQFILDAGKTPVVCKEGGIINRILGIYMNEACHLAIEGCTIQNIDKALVDFGFSIGPFRLMDDLGIWEVLLYRRQILEDSLGSRFALPEEFQRMLRSQDDTLGVKTGLGFYLYDGKGKPTAVNPIMQGYLTELSAKQKSKTQLSSYAIVDRCLLSMINEACHILPSSSSSHRNSVRKTTDLTLPVKGNSDLPPSTASSSRRQSLKSDESAVFPSPASIDLAVILTGFPPFLGGLLAYADQRGLDEVLSRLRVWRWKEGGERFEAAKELVRRVERKEKFFPTRPEVKTLKRIAKEEMPKMPNLLQLMASLIWVWVSLLVLLIGWSWRRAQ